MKKIQKTLNEHILTVTKEKGLFGLYFFRVTITKQNSKKVLWTMISDSLEKIKKDKIFIGLVKQYSKPQEKSQKFQNILY